MPNDGEPEQSGGDAQAATVDNNSNPSSEPWAPEADCAEPWPDTGPVDLESSQGQQAQNPPGDVDPGETFPIPSAIDTDDIRGNTPYQLKPRHPDLFSTHENQYMDLLLCDSKMKRRIQQGEDIPNNSNPGETHPIPSIMATSPDPEDGPYDPHEERSYTVLITKLGRTEAKDLREHVRNNGLDAFCSPPWENVSGNVRENVREKGWSFRMSHKTLQESLTYVCSGNRRGLNEHLSRQMDKGRHKARVWMVVQWDGGEVRIEGSVPKGRHNNFSALIEVFDQFQV